VCTGFDLFEDKACLLFLGAGVSPPAVMDITLKLSDQVQGRVHDQFLTSCKVKATMLTKIYA
jgi:hypothetical protein